MLSGDKQLMSVVICLNSLGGSGLISFVVVGKQYKSGYSSETNRSVHFYREIFQVEVSRRSFFYPVGLKLLFNNSPTHCISM